MCFVDLCGQFVSKLIFTKDHGYVVCLKLTSGISQIVITFPDTRTHTNCVSINVLM